jgi:hypothetical protein
MAIAPKAVAEPRQQRVPKEEERTAGILAGPTIRIDSDF